MSFFSTSGRLETGGVPFVSNNPKPTRAEALEYYRRIAMSSQLNIRLFEEVLEVNREQEHYRVITSKEVNKAKHVIVASGFYDISNRSEERRVGNEWVSPCSTRWSPYHKKKTLRQA